MEGLSTGSRCLMVWQMVLKLWRREVVVLVVASSFLFARVLHIAPNQAREKRARRGVMGGGKARRKKSLVGV